MIHKKRKTDQAGFTIVELMISLSILAVILLISSVTLIQLGRIFTKGSNQANAQNTARSIVNDISTKIQFSGAAPNIVVSAMGTNAICLGSARYTYKLQHRLTNADTDHSLWLDTMKTSGTCQVNLNFDTSATPEDNLSVVGSGSELLPVGMRLTRFDVTGNPNGSYTVTATVAYSDSVSGADDLVNYDPVSKITTCKSTTGSEYCGVSSLTKTVIRRLAN